AQLLNQHSAAAWLQPDPVAGEDFSERAIVDQSLLAQPGHAFIDDFSRNSVAPKASAELRFSPGPIFEHAQRRLPGGPRLIPMLQRTPLLRVHHGADGETGGGDDFGRELQRFAHVEVDHQTLPRSRYLIDRND